MLVIRRWGMLSVHDATGSCLDGEEGICVVDNLKNEDIQLVCPQTHKKTKIPNLKDPNVGVIDHRLGCVPKVVVSQVLVVDG